MQRLKHRAGNTSGIMCHIQNKGIKECNGVIDLNEDKYVLLGCHIQNKGIKECNKIVSECI